MGPLTVLADVVDEHAQRLASLWTDRSVLVQGRTATLSELRRVDRKMRAHVAALVLSGDAGWNVVEHLGLLREPESAFVALVVAARTDPDHRAEHVVSLFDTAEAFPGLLSALGWLPAHVAIPLLNSWAQYDGPRWRSLALAGFVAQRFDPGPLVHIGLHHHDVDVRGQAIRASGVFRRSELAPMLHEGVRDLAGLHRFWVARALHQLRWPGAMELLVGLAERGGPGSERAAELAARQLSSTATLELVRNLASRAGAERRMVVAASSSGMPSTIELLLGAMHAPETAQLAGYGFSAITGIDLEDEELIEDIDPHAVGSFDPALAGLPWPDPRQVAPWWEAQEVDFGTLDRWRWGEPMNVRGLRQLLAAGPLYERSLAAHDLFMLHRCQAVPFEADAPSWRQARWLAPLVELLRVGPAR